MSVLLTNGTVFVEGSLREQAARLVSRASDDSLEFMLADAGGPGVAVPVELNAFLTHVLRGLSRGDVAVRTLPEELTTTVAAELIGVSRPTLMKLVRSGQLPFHQVGSHTRLRTSDVLALRRSRARDRREALAALRGLDDEFGAD